MIRKSFQILLPMILGISACKANASVDLMWSPQGAGVPVYGLMDPNSDPNTFMGSDELIRISGALKSFSKDHPIRTAAMIGVAKRAIQASYDRGMRSIDLDPNMAWFTPFCEALNQVNSSYAPGQRIKVRLSINIPGFMFAANVEGLIKGGATAYSELKDQISWLANDVNYASVVGSPSLNMSGFTDVRKVTNYSVFINATTEYLDVLDSARRSKLQYDPGRSNYDRQQMKKLFPVIYRNGVDAIGERVCYTTNAIPNIADDDVMLRVAALIGRSMDRASTMLSAGGTVISSVVFRNNEVAESNIGAGNGCDLDGTGGRDVRTEFTGSYLAANPLDRANNVDYSQWKNFYSARQAQYKRFLQWAALVVKSKAIRYPSRYDTNIRFGFYYPAGLNAWQLGFYDYYSLIKGSGSDFLINSSSTDHIDMQIAGERRIALTSSVSSQLNIPWENEFSWPTIELALSGWLRFVEGTGDDGKYWYPSIKHTVVKTWNGSPFSLSGDNIWYSEFFNSPAGVRASDGNWAQMKAAAAYGVSAITYANWPVDIMLSGTPSSNWERLIGPVAPNSTFKAKIDVLPKRPIGKIALYLPAKGMITCENADPHPSPYSPTQFTSLLGGCNSELYNFYLHMRLQAMAGADSRIEVFTDGSLKDFSSRLGNFTKIVVPMEMAARFSDLDQDIQTSLQNVKDHLFFMKVTPPTPIMAH